jgi:ATP-binding cassette subfamily B protein
MITRANHPSRGQVLMDGRDLETVAPDSLYGQMSIVAQESLLFDASVRENIRVGRLGATDAEVEKAARLAEVHDTIQALPNGYNTVVGERGCGLSGGQRQRIAIARALVRSPRILVLDEATSALDPVTEDAIACMLEKVGQRLTMISVTHRLATVAHFDRIYVMQSGGVADFGSHTELLSRPGTYRNLWDKQSGVHVTPSGDARVMPALLATMPIFETMTDDARVLLAEQFVTVRVPDNYELFRAGDVGDAFYVIARGRVQILIEGRPARVLDDGDSFGEIALLDDGLRTGRATTAAPSTLLMLSRQRFREIIAREPGLAEALRAKAHGHLVDDLGHADQG